jgi:hypothetical protein
VEEMESRVEERERERERERDIRYVQSNQTPSQTLDLRGLLIDRVF